VIVPLADWKERYSVTPWMIEIAPEAQNGLAKPSAADAFQTRSVSKDRFVQHIGGLNSDQLGQILNAVQKVIGAA
jgi:mRNA interferase MazF